MKAFSFVSIDRLAKCHNTSEGDSSETKGVKDKIVVKSVTKEEGSKQVILSV